MADQQAEQTYSPGISLELQILPGSSDPPSPESSGSLRVCVTTVFHPFTKSQVMRVTIPSQPSSSAFPTNAVLKLYDRRWIDDRKKQPWSPAREAIARAAWSEKKRDDVENLDDSRAGDPKEPAEWEEHYRRMAGERFHIETEAYRRLSHLQGTIMPRCYASVRVTPLPADNHIPQTFVFGLILEDIDGVDLPQFDPSAGDYGHYASLGHSLVAAVYTFPEYGVLHCDIRSHNILISPTRISLIDFGEANVRKAETTDEEWKTEVREEEVVGLRILLTHRRIRDRTPVDTRHRCPEEKIPWHTMVSNTVVRQYSPEWRKRWYNEVPQPSVKCRNREVELSLWILKDDVATWLDSRPPPPQCFLTPRPGSPESPVPSPNMCEDT